MRPEDRRREAAQDRVLLRTTAAIAVFAATAAAALNMAPGEPGLRGLEHLALFARPSRGRDVKPIERAEPAQASAPDFAAPATPSPQMAAATPLTDDPPVVSAAAGKPLPVGADAAPDTPLKTLTGAAAATPLTGWRIYDMVGERALLAGPGGVAWATAGVDLGEAGVVSRIEVTREGVAVVTSKGEIKSRR
jgi:hypothetical protein